MMKQSLIPAAVVLLGLAAAGCQDSGTPASNSPALDLSDAFSTMPVGFSEVQNTFADSSGTGWTPGAAGRGHHGGGGGMMCGGLGGLVGFGLDLGRDHGLLGGDLSGNCAFDAASGRVACDPVTRDRLSITRSAQYTDASGAVQPAFDSLTTNSINAKVTVNGTRIRRDGDTAQVQHASDRTVTGLASGSTARTVDGTSAGMETTTGSDTVGAFEAVRTIGDTIQDVVVPAGTDASGTRYPTAGTIIRSMQVTVTYTGQSPTSSYRREVVTFDGSNTATVVVTRDGTTQNCTLPLPRGRLSCSGSTT
jgi:hypothetical protein